MREILPGVVHWTARHPNLGSDVSCYALPAAGVALNPMEPAEGLGWFREHGTPRDVLLTNRHHFRDSDAFVRAFGCTVHCHRSGLGEFGPDTEVQPFDFGDALPGGAVAHEVDAISPEETALHLPSVRALAFADGLVDLGRGLSFVPDELIGDDPAAVKRGLLAAFARLLELDFDALLLAHGDPVPRGGKAALRRFVDEAG